MSRGCVSHVESDFSQRTALSYEETLTAHGCDRLYDCQLHDVPIFSGLRQTFPDFA